MKNRVFDKKFLFFLPTLFLSSELYAGSKFWGNVNTNFRQSSGVLLAERLETPSKDLRKHFPLSAYKVFSIDIDQDGAADFIIESKTKNQTCFVKSDFSIKRCEAFNYSLNDGFAYEFFFSPGPGKMLMLLDFSGDEDNFDYFLKAFDPKTWKLEKITELYPLVESDSKDRKGIYWGYPWDIDSLPIKNVNGETAILATFDQRIDEEPMMGGSEGDTTKGPAILFKGNATQGGERGAYDQLRKRFRFIPITRIVQAAQAKP